MALIQLIHHGPRLVLAIHLLHKTYYITSDRALSSKSSTTKVSFAGGKCDQGDDLWLSSNTSIPSVSLLPRILYLLVVVPAVIK